MPLSDSKIRALVPGDKRRRVADADGLCVVVEPTHKGGGISFVGRFRFPPGRKGKQGDYRIGVYGRGVGEFSLKAAREEWEKVRTWSRENQRPPTDLKKGWDDTQNTAGVHTFEEACDAWDREYSGVSDKNKPEYRRLIKHQLFPEFGASTNVAHLEWDYVHPDGRTSREWVVNYLDRTRKRAPTSADKQETLLRQIFANAARNNWIKGSQNPAGEKIATPKQKKERRQTATSYPDLERDEVLEFFKAFNANACDGSVITRGSLLLLWMTGLRVDCVVGMEWSEVDHDEGVWWVPSERLKTWEVGEDAHRVHLTDPMKDLLERMGKLSGGERFVFPGRKQSGVPKHLNRESPNTHISNLGYKGRFQAHGIRSTVRTLAQEVCGTDDFVAALQGAWKVKDPIRQVYDRNSHPDERRDHLISWSDALLDFGMDIDLI